jgi:hypothetical protein
MKSLKNIPYYVTMCKLRCLGGTVFISHVYLEMHKKLGGMMDWEKNGELRERTHVQNGNGRM